MKIGSELWFYSLQQTAWSPKRSLQLHQDVRHVKIPSKELTYTAQISLRASGKLDAAKVSKNVSTGSASKPVKYKNALKQVREEPSSPDKALSLITESKLSKNQCNLIHNCTLQICFGI